MAGSAASSAGCPAPGPVLWVQDRAPATADEVAAVLTLEACGQRVLVHALPPAALGRCPARVLPRPGGGQVVRAHLGLLVRAPVRWLALAARSGAGPAARRAFVQSGLVADRARREGARRVQAHAGTPAAAVARDAGRLTGVPVTLSVPPGGSGAGAAGGSVLCVCPGVPGGRLDPLLTALGLLVDDRPGLRLEVVGDLPDDGALERSVSELGLEDRVVLRGPLSPARLRAAVSRCAVLVLPHGAAGTPDHAGRPAVLLHDPAHGVPADPVLLAVTLAVTLAALLDSPGPAGLPGSAGRATARGTGRWRRGGDTPCVPGPGGAQPRDG